MNPETSAPLIEELSSFSPSAAGTTRSVTSVGLAVSYRQSVPSFHLASSYANSADGCHTGGRGTHTFST